MYFSMKDSGHFDKCNFPFLYLRRSRVLFVHLVQFADTLVCELGFWGPLRAPEAVALFSVKYAFSHIFWYCFFKKFNLHFMQAHYKISILMQEILGILTNVFQNWFSLQIH